jgi:hypothetical protein
MWWYCKFSLLTSAVQTFETPPYYVLGEFAGFRVDARRSVSKALPSLIFPNRKKPFSVQCRFGSSPPLSALEGLGEP